MIEDAIDAVGGGWGLGAAVALGLGLVAIRSARPLTKAAIRGYLTATSAAAGGISGIREVPRTVREWGAGVAEKAQDLYAEAQAELGSAPAARPEAAS
jgi:hypothetical protein